MPDFPRFDLTDQIALVTGAGRGLGRAAALALAHAGADIALGLLDKNRAGGLAEEIEALGRRALPLQMDVADLAQVSAAVDETVARFGRIDVLVNNAGIAPENLAEAVTVQDFDETCAVNLKGTFFVSQAAGRVMIRQRSGRIVNLSSQAGFVALPGESVYCMTKAAISHLTKCLAVEWGKHGITVNAVTPGLTASDGVMASPHAQAFGFVEMLQAIPGQGQPRDIAPAIAFLASDEARWITGQTLNVDGGMVRW